VLGSLSTFLGIGGGPINVTLLILFFGIDIKQSTVYSIITIFFSQLSKLITIFMTMDLNQFDLTFLMVIIPAALTGGYLGGTLSNKFRNQQVNLLFNIVVGFVILINLYNLFSVLV